jgi:hypothetical protein
MQGEARLCFADAFDKVEVKVAPTQSNNGTRTMNARKSLIAAAACAAFSLPATAATVQLQFEGLTAADAAGGRADVAVDAYYNGGTSKNLQTNAPVQAGPDLGVVFTGIAAATESLVDNQGTADTFRRTRTLLLADGSSVQSDELGTGALYAAGAVPGAQASFTMNVAAGFNDSLSFFYNAGQAGGLSVTIASILNGANLSATSNFPEVAGCLQSQNSRCIWAQASMNFQGLATSVTFSGLAFDFLIDNITLSSLNPRTLSVTPPPVEPPTNPIPEPSTYALMLLGLAALGVAARRRAR